MQGNRGILGILASGAVVIGIITAVGLHSAGLAQAGTAGAKGTSQVYNTVERG